MTTDLMLSSRSSCVAWQGMRCTSASIPMVWQHSSFLCTYTRESGRLPTMMIRSFGALLMAFETAATPCRSSASHSAATCRPSRSLAGPLACGRGCGGCCTQPRRYSDGVMKGPGGSERIPRAASLEQVRSAAAYIGIGAVLHGQHDAANPHAHITHPSWELFRTMRRPFSTRRNSISSHNWDLPSSRSPDAVQSSILRRMQTRWTQQPRGAREDLFVQTCADASPVVPQQRKLEERARMTRLVENRNIL